MTELELDGARISSLADLYDQVMENPATPNYFGRNLDALYDTLFLYEPPIHVRWMNSDQSRVRMGEDFSRVVSLLLDFAEEAHERGLDYKFELIESSTE